MLVPTSSALTAKRASRGICARSARKSLCAIELAGAHAHMERGGEWEHGNCCNFCELFAPIAPVLANGLAGSLAFWAAHACACANARSAPPAPLPGSSSRLASSTLRQNGRPTPSFCPTQSEFACSLDPPQVAPPERRLRSHPTHCVPSDALGPQFCERRKGHRSRRRLCVRLQQRLHWRWEQNLRAEPTLASCLYRHLATLG